MKVKEIMSTNIHACRPDSDLAGISKLMWDYDCGFVPVVDASGHLAGTVTDRDICVATATRRRLPEHISAAEVMSTPVRAVLADETVSAALETMKKFQLRRLPVIDEFGHLRGVLSMNDIVRASEHHHKALPAGEIVSTMAAICAHRPVLAATA